MTPEEFSNQFDLHYNNITSNQAPGLTEYEKSVFLTKAQDEIVKNYFSPQSKGNNLQQGFDDSAKRQADFSVLMDTKEQNKETSVSSIKKIDQRSILYKFPSDVFIVINEALFKAAVPAGEETPAVPAKYFQVIPLRYDEYTRLMSKPFKRPLKNQVWRLINSGSVSSSTYTKYVEIITGPDYDTDDALKYEVRYLRRPKPIITGNLDGLTINGYYLTGTTAVSGATAIDGVCELDPILHEDILQRAVELAKIAWTATGQDNAQMVITAGQRSE